MSRIRLFTLLLAGLLATSLLSLSGCGNKGPLYLPDSPNQTDTPK